MLNCLTIDADAYFVRISGGILASINDLFLLVLTRNFLSTLTLPSPREYFDGKHYSIKASFLACSGSLLFDSVSRKRAEFSLRYQIRSINLKEK